MYIVRNSLILHKSIFMLIVLKIIVFNFLSFVAGTHQHYAVSSQPAFRMRYECTVWMDIENLVIAKPAARRNPDLKLFIFLSALHDILPLDGTFR